MIQPQVTVFSLDGDPLWETATPERISIHAPFGAMEANATVVPGLGDVPPPPPVGGGVEIRLDEVLKFRGTVAEIRTDSAGSPLTVTAKRRPERLYQGAVRGIYEEMSPTEILSAILELLPGPTPVYSGSPASGRTIDRLDFQGIPLFYAVDLLAKLAGNWLWRIDWEGELHLIPPDSPPEHVWHHDPDRMVLRPGLTDRSVENLFAFRGGVVGGAEFVRFFEDPASRARFGDIEERLFARAVATAPTFELLKGVVLEQSPQPTVHRSIDRYDETIEAFFGERFELRGSPLPTLVEDPVFRIAAEEIEWSGEGMRTRYLLAGGYESASRFDSYLDHDPLGVDFVAARLGPFTLDLSALDSEARLDP